MSALAPQLAGLGLVRSKVKSSGSIWDDGVNQRRSSPAERSEPRRIHRLYLNNLRPPDYQHSISNSKDKGNPIAAEPIVFTKHFENTEHPPWQLKPLLASSLLHPASPSSEPAPTQPSSGTRVREHLRHNQERMMLLRPNS